MSHSKFINVQKALEIPEILSIVDSIKKIDEKKTLWGVAPIAPLHIGYDSLILLQKVLMESGCSHTILLSDIHAMMSHGLSFNDVNVRSNYYQYYLSNICGLNTIFIRGSYFQTRPGYVEDLYGLLAAITVSKIKDSFPVSRKGEPFFSYKVIYPIMQCLDCNHTDTRIVVAEEGQKKIYRLTEEIRKAQSLRIWISNRFSKEIYFFYIPTSHDIMGNPLLVSSAKTRISIHETAESLSKKMRQMYAPPGKQPINSGRVNALLEFFKYSVFPWTTESIRIKTNRGSVQHYDHYMDFERDYNEGLITPEDAKKTLYNELLTRINIIQDEFRKALTYWVDVEKAVGGSI